MFGVVDDTTTTKFVNRACAVHGISLPVVVDKVVVVVLKFPNVTIRTTKTVESVQLNGVVVVVLKFPNISGAPRAAPRAARGRSPIAKEMW